MVVNWIFCFELYVLLVEKSVVGVVLQYLLEVNVVVVYNVKLIVIEVVLRIVNMFVILFMDMFSFGVWVGICESFEVKIYVNYGIKGKKKMYIFFLGCFKDCGCIIVLCGVFILILLCMKCIIEFMVYVVYNLKLELCLMCDEFVQILIEIEFVLIFIFMLW